MPGYICCLGGPLSCFRSLFLSVWPIPLPCLHHTDLSLSLSLWIWRSFFIYGTSSLRLQVALRWFCAKSLLCSEGLTRDLIDRIPGKQTDRKTPLGELNWIFTAITDTIAWNTLPRALFQRLFRQVGHCALYSSGYPVARKWLAGLESAVASPLRLSLCPEC
jgi:hypothetical protein